MKKALFALSLLVVAPIIVADDVVPAEVPAEVPALVPAEVPALVPAEVPALVPEKFSEVKPNLFARSLASFEEGLTFVKNGVSYSVVSFKDGVFTAYDKVTGKIEAFTPQMILNARDSIRGTIANYPLTAVALTAYVAVKAAEYFSDSSADLEDEDDSF